MSKLGWFNSRRDFLCQTWNGIGALALGGMMAQEATAGPSAANPLAVRPQHLKRKAKHCIFMFMAGGVSQMDSFDYKPELQKLHNGPLPKIPEISGELQGRLSFPHSVVASPFEFHQYGESGRYISNLFPHIGSHCDDLAFIYGIKTDNQNHGPATLHINTGDQFPGSPSVGSWVAYGLGSPNQDLPGYAVIQDPRGAPCNGATCWANGYLPASYQGTLLRASGTPILNLQRSSGLSRQQQRREFDILRWMNDLHRDSRPGASELEARIHAYELAFRMQAAAPELVELAQEPGHVKKLYGLDNPQTADFGRQCLLARRLVERGVRFTLLVHGVQINQHSWDDHGDVKGGMIKHSAEVDLPVGALLTDLKQRGLYDDTLVVWASEMGRTPFINGKLVPRPGRDHNSYGLVMWMAGGDVKGASSSGQTDDFGLRSVGEPIHVRDVHATILELLGLDQNQLDYLHGGRLRKLTDIGGKVLHEIIANS